MKNYDSGRLRWTLAMTLLIGCSGRPAAIRPVRIEPRSAADKAMELYDRDQDGQLSSEEMKSVPALAKYKRLYDSDQSGTISADEIATRLSLWKKQKLGMRELLVEVKLDGKPLAGATVKFLPEPYMGAEVKPAFGETNEIGVTSVGINAAEMPAQLQKMQIAVITGGSYKIEVTHPSVKIPAKYNSQTTLGEEVALDAVREQTLLELSSR